MKRRSWKLAAAAAVGLWLAVGCGTGRPPPAGDGTGSGVGSAGGGPTFGVDAGTKPPGCGTAPDGTYCECIDVPLFVDPPNMYFVLDRSGSMADQNKWTQVRIVVGKILRALGPRANFGAMIYPGSASNVCSAGAEIMATRPGDPPSSGVDGPTTETLLTRTQVQPYGGTPTSATLEAVLPIVQKLPGETFVIVATDGAPNCNAYATCGFDACMPNIEDMEGCPKEGPANCCEPPDGFRENCLDRSASTAAAAALKNAGIPVYVIGLPGAAPYASVLDELAVAGGTASAGAPSPKYFAVDASSEAAMLAALKRVAAKIVATCEFTLKDAPSDPRLVNVYLDDVVLPFDPVSGWTIDGAKVTLVGDACARVTRGDVLDVRIIAGCPRIEVR